MPRLLSQAADGRLLLGNRFIFPGATKPTGDVLFGWTDITHSSVRFSSAYTGNITEEHFRAMQRHVRAIEPLVDEDIRQATEQELFGELEDVS